MLGRGFVSVYGNNFGGPFLPPNMTYGPMMRASAMPMMSMHAGRAGLGGGLKSLLGLSGRGAAAGARGISWSALLGNASRALNVVNQAIPIVKEAGPMISNMKSMIKIASIFKDETDSTTVRTQNNASQNNNQPEISNITKESDTISSTTINQNNNNEPNFFL